MLQIRSNCENCNKSLAPNSTKAMICSYECTFCADCVNEVLHNVCPNCGGGFEKRPIRPKGGIAKHPPSGKLVFNPVDMETFLPLMEKNENIPPDQR
ncbi:MAG: DUF1272 domain-containing protein [Reichenbachiella sp.]|uniref:DUF1272 domain-containing protein n=1 Tax=Reichenbachiella sp. TaxID=2184521 RepID=UPI003262DC55